MLKSVTMVKAVISDLSKTLLYSTDKNYTGSLNDLHESHKEHHGYNFWEYFGLNHHLLALYKKLSKHIRIFIFTTKYIQEFPPLKKKLNNIFTEIFSAAKLKVKKSDPMAYKIITQRIKIPPNKVLFVDDNWDNIKVAQKADMITIHFQSEIETIRIIKQFFPSHAR